MFHHSLPDRIYSSSTRRVCAYICIKHLAKNMVSDAQHAKLFTSALYKLMIILSLSIFVCAAIINHTLFFSAAELSSENGCYGCISFDRIRFNWLPGSQRAVARRNVLPG
jgi:hypothetical protein